MKDLIILAIFCLVGSVLAQRAMRTDTGRHHRRQMGYRGYQPRYMNYMNMRGLRGGNMQDNGHLSRMRRYGKQLTGPHVCITSGQKHCCAGWRSDMRETKCNIPECPDSCDPGICTRPGFCLCPDGSIESNCNKPDLYRTDKCMLRCMNGGTCAENECACVDGFTGAHCGQPICGPGCLNGGRCISPNKCLCTYGFTGDRCQTDYRVAPCFLTRANDTCMDQVPGVTCSKKLCCATIGQGWGVPCEECPARVGNCTRGRMPPKCEDINECKLIPGLCKDGTCVNTDGSFRCECPDGYKYDNKLHQCIDIDECVEQGLCENGECTNTVGGFMCKCPPDYKLSADQTYCISDVPGFCYTSIESGMCASPLEQLTRRTECCCHLIGDEQETLGKCFSVPGHRPERCAAVGTPEFTQTCTGDHDDIFKNDICAVLGAQACENGICQPVGTKDYQCQCNDGYTPIESAKGCIDVNECGDGVGGRDICGMHGTCMNTDGSYVCHCDPGFGNGDDMVSCLDIDECREDGLCENGNCINTLGSFRCSCDDGYRVTPTQQACEDYNECIERSDLCEFGRCINTEGSFRCVCNPGFIISEDLTSCKDQNECETTGMCSHGTCVNRNGGFECSCDNGFELSLDGKHCEDIDECIQKPCINGECENRDGDFVCHCHRFQQLDETGRKCVLDKRRANCYRNVRNGQCTELNALETLTTRAECCCAVPGGISAWDDCEPCPETSSENYGILCTEATINNMCAMLAEPCINGVCISMADNDYRCECNQGFIPSEDRKECRDIDECHENMMMCSNGECRNTPGSFACTCHEGFVLKGDVCEDVDECLSNPCTDGDCVNMAGDFRCECDENSQLDIHGRVCYDVQLQRCWRKYGNGTCEDNVNRPLTVEECCNSVGVAWGNVNCRPCEEFDLKCNKGYRYDIANDHCVDINECTFDVCGEDATCVNTDGSYFCRCDDGLTLDGNGRDCIDLRVGTCFYFYEESSNECSRPTAGAEMRKAECCCTIGQGWGDPCEGCPVRLSAEFDKLCRDILIGPDRGVNECIEFPDLCENGKCENTVEGFVCICNTGFAIDETDRMCVDIPECEISPGLCGQGVCVNTNGSFVCQCDEGYYVSPAGDECVDMDECLAGGRCTGGDCHNTQGSYECTCPEGRSLSEDGTRCVDVDECAVMKDLCQPNGECVNMLGFFICVCNPGFETTPDQQSCVDIDECANDNGGCSTICINLIGSYECRCDEGFTLTYDGHTCSDIDECIEQPNRCDGGRCENIDGTFRCTCFDGFMAVMDLQFCEDIDECAMNPHICMNGKCHNTRGSYTCNCDPGYCVPQGQMICVDEDECELGKHTCDVNADCTNNDGSFVCECIAGFVGDGHDCDDVDECASGNHTCDPNAVCENTHGSFACNCEDGFFGDGYSCSDTDDCLADENLCGPHGTCLNIQGSFECDCPDGFMTTIDRKACKDIDECAISHICVNGRCHNNPGAFKCECLQGFEKDEQGGNCTDIDECEDVANCINGECVNTIGTYECRCPEGFSPNPTGVGCVDTRTGDCFLTVEGDDLAPICSHPIGIGVARAGCCCSTYGEGWGNPCEICPDSNSTEFQTLCPGGDGFRPNPITVLLEDIDECMELPGLCQGGKCVNVFGSFICECPEGYDLNEKNRVCEDVDECTDADNVCGPGTCVNSVGGFSCLCPEGYKPINRGRVCEDQRESSCFRYFNESSLQCTEQLPFNITKKICCCTEGFGSGWNNPCEVCPIPGTDDFLDLCSAGIHAKGKNICKKVEGLCLNGICVDKEEGGYRCECPLGFRFNEEMLYCEDIDECAGNGDICRLNAQCVNLPGSYRCSCREGFTENRNGDCVDVDECDEEGACSNGNCNNVEGGFICDCNQGFRGINGDAACEDVDECELEPCGHGACQNMIGSFICSCDNGYTLSDNGDCVDQNECEASSKCRNGECINEPGTFSCLCEDGYNVSPDGRSCVDANECAEDESICGVGSCQNMDGGYKCFCPTGYSNIDGGECIDDDECDLLDMCKFGTCINTPGGFSCDCPDNFALSSDKKFCIDMRRGTCYNDYENGQCLNGLPAVVTRGVCCCRCTSAAWGEQGSCEACPDEGTEAFSDLCPQGCGFTPNGDDINECVENNPCKNGKCRNLAGGFKCECTIGFKLDETGTICIDEDECVERGQPCGPGTCTNKDGGFECDCLEGYYNGPKMRCLDIDECAQGISECKYRCQNTDGSFVCLCPDGFHLNADGKTCSDTDECSDPDLNGCEEKGMTCKNNIGYFTCLCPSGYRKIGVSDTCENIDECAQAGVCLGGVCIDSDGTYQCECDEGYEYDEAGRRCIDVRQGLCYSAVHQRTCEITATTGQMVTKTECCCSRGAGWGMDCEECPHVSSKEFVKMCPHGPGFNWEGEDIDDCATTPGLCANGTCTNLLGSFKCICDRGFMPTENMQACIDIDECMLPNGCAGGSQCINTYGGYKCECPAGYQITNTMRCVDKDECATKEHACQFICINTIGGYHCGCPHGFAMHMNESCVDKNECELEPEICGKNARCVNDVGGYHCVCAPGFEKNAKGDGCIGLPCESLPKDVCGGQMCMNVGEGIRCVPGCDPRMRLRFNRMRCYNIDDCRVRPCGAGSRCAPSNEPDYWKCSCMNGYNRNGMGRGCGDVNECNFMNSPCQYSCQNNRGGFQCGCPRGYFGLGLGHCMNGMGGFQQPAPPQYGPQYGRMPFMGGRSRCYDCGSGPIHRQRRSAEVRMEDVSSFEDERPSVNISAPIILHLNANELMPRQRLVRLLPALRVLNDHTVYSIVSGNDAGMFRIHKHDNMHFIHVNRGFAAEEGPIVPGKYQIKVQAKPTLSNAEAKKASLNNLAMEKALKEILKFDVEFDIEK